MTKNKSKQLNYRRKVIVIPLKYKKNYAHIFTKESMINIGHTICVPMVRHNVGSAFYPFYYLVRVGVKRLSPKYAIFIEMIFQKYFQIIILLNWVGKILSYTRDRVNFRQGLTSNFQGQIEKYLWQQRGNIGGTIITKCISKSKSTSPKKN